MNEVLVRFQGQHYPNTIQVDPTVLSDPALPWGVPTQGSVVGVLLNDTDSWDSLADEFHQAPYKAAPRAPVLYLKPANTWAAHGAPIVVPADLNELEVGASVGVVLGRSAARVTAADAFQYIAGYVPVNDLAEPHESVYRPAIRERCRDGFCPIGPWVMPRHALRSPDALVLRTFVNGRLRAEETTARLIRSTTQLIADVTAFMTLDRGDVLLLGPGADRPRAKPGDTVQIEVLGVGILQNRLVRAQHPSAP